MLNRTAPFSVTALAIALCLSACAETEVRPRTEDDARQLAPLPACLRQTASKQAGVVKSLGEDEAWQLVYPSFDKARHVLPADAAACTGRHVLEGKDLAGGKPKPVIQEGDASFASGGDRLKVVWLRSLAYDDGTEGGALALVRALEGTIEVYAVTGFRGRPKTLFSLERVGPELVVVATDDGCKGRKPGAGCETPVTVLVPRYGVLERGAAFAQERIAYAEGTEPGVPGKVEYRLASATTFVEGGIRVLEQVMVKDDAGREVRRAELERAYTFAPDGSLVVSDDSLWSRVIATRTPSR
jgi:hypothetical protein